MKKSHFASGMASLLLFGALLLGGVAQAQNVAIVNGKPVPTARVEAFVTQLKAQAAAQGQQLPPDIEQRVKNKVVMDEIFTQEAEKRGLAGSADYKQQMEIARQAVLMHALRADFQARNPVTDAEVQAEYDKFKSQNSGTEYRARHILVETEDEAKALIAKIKAGASFDELAKKNSKDPGSGAKGGDLGFASPGSYVPEFSQAMVKLKKGEMTQEPVKSQFGWHIIKLEDTREASFPPLDDVKAQLKQRLEQQKLGDFLDGLRSSAKTDFKFTN